MLISAKPCEEEGKGSLKLVCCGGVLVRFPAVSDGGLISGCEMPEMAQILKCSGLGGVWEGSSGTGLAPVLAVLLSAPASTVSPLVLSCRGKSVQPSPATGTDVSRGRRPLRDALLGMTSVRYGLGGKSRTAGLCPGACVRPHHVNTGGQAQPPTPLLLPDEEDRPGFCGRMQQGLQGCQARLR